ncbi:BQ2448_6476 [Microbotryum intermedium]|uniref:BQ2448_6476 protein n=1 Tax=Microbotryum intermedium TaxID=269621 RepID=A0A238FQ86_9BASI|nr:BQ2448_6476 [Microbotryum intermedium]
MPIQSPSSSNNYYGQRQASSASTQQQQQQQQQQQLSPSSSSAVDYARFAPPTSSSSPSSSNPPSRQGSGSASIGSSAANAGATDRHHHNSSNEMLHVDDHEPPEPNFAGRGAGRHSQNLGNGMALPPINTLLQPYGSAAVSSPLQHAQLSPPPTMPTSAASPGAGAGASTGTNGSPRMSYLSRSLHAAPPVYPHAPSSSSPATTLAARPGCSASTSSPGAPIGGSFASTSTSTPTSYSPSTRTSSPSARETHSPPSKSHSNSSTTSGGTSHSQRSPRTSNFDHPGHFPPAPTFLSTSVGSLSTSSTVSPSYHGPREVGSSSAGAREGYRPDREGKRERTGGQNCAKCDLPMTGQFVRALGTVYHLDCFRCLDCNKVVANKFFPIDAPDSSSGKQVPLCETDYFRRLNLLCQKCGQALRGSYITALDMKFHVEHFTCSICPTVFGPQDSYYEHAGSVYCHFHYSTRFAVKCTGCRTAILKQFVEINRNSVDEHWHPECYMINKFWNIKLALSPAVKAVEPASEMGSDAISIAAEGAPDANGLPSKPLEAKEYLAQEEAETPTSLKARQKLMEEQVYRIWTVLSAFEESSAGCISEMLRHVSSGHYIDGVQMAEKFVVHVETLFAAIDDLSAQFKLARTKEISHVREARMLCKKVVSFFSLLSHTHETGARKMSITQDLLSLVTGLAHYLKILIRIALTAALKLEREFDNLTAIAGFLTRLDQLAHDPEASTKNSPKNSLDLHGADPQTNHMNGQASARGKKSSEMSREASARSYRYKSLMRPDGSTLVGSGEATTDLCEGCHLTVEEECARYGTSHRWHLPCLRCKSCGKSASRDRPVSSQESAENVWWPEFRVEAIGNGVSRVEILGTYCKECVGLGRVASDANLRQGFDYVTRLEQYAFLLCVALKKLYALLKQRGVVPSSPTDEDSSDERSLYDTYRDSTDIKRMKSVNLDRKLSSTTARTPKRSVVVQSPSGRVAQPNDTTIPLFTGKPPVPSRKDQPLIDPIRGTTVRRPPSQPPAAPSNSTHPKSTDASSAMGSSSASSIVSASSNATAVPPTPTMPIATSARPIYNRTTTAVQIIDDQPLDTSPTTFEPVLGGSREPTQDEDGITLADLSTVMQAEQKREQMRYQPTRSIATPSPLLSELSALEYLIVRHIAALLLTTEAPNARFSFRDVVTLDELLEVIDERKNTFWGKLFKGGKEKKIEKKKGVFGIPIEVLVERNGADSMHGAGPGSLRIPSFVDDVISAMKQMDMSIEGIFRKNGNIRRLKELSEALDRDAAAVNLSDDNPVQIAALLKRFLRDLPDPLIPFKLFQLFIATQRVDHVQDRKRALHMCCCLLPKSHRDTLEAIFVFLKWVASFSHVDEETGSKMDLLNLATVVSPNVLYSKGKDPARDESFSSVRAVHELLEWQDELWQVSPPRRGGHFSEVPTDFVAVLSDQEFFSNPSQLTSKEILARADLHVRSSARKGSAPTPASQRNEPHPPRPDLHATWSASSVSPVTGPGPMARSTYPPLPTAGGNHPSKPLSERPLSSSIHHHAMNGNAIPVRSIPSPQTYQRSPVGSPDLNLTQ